MSSLARMVPCPAKMFTSANGTKIKYFYSTSTEHNESRDFECPSSRGIPDKYNGQREIRCV